jgi:hypothetical protein
MNTSCRLRSQEPGCRRKGLKPIGLNRWAVGGSQKRHVPSPKEERLGYPRHSVSFRDFSPKAHGYGYFAVPPNDGGYHIGSTSEKLTS